MAKRSPTTKDIALLHQLFQNDQLSLAAEFQRNAVWPRKAKAYLIDTVINDRPIPLLFFQRSTSAQKGVPSYIVIDGQQRLRAIFDFLDNRFRLSQSGRNTPYYNKKFDELDGDIQEKIRNYDLVIEELSGYTDADIRDMFVRINKYVVQLAPQELRHAKGSGKFNDFVETMGKWDFWKTHKVFSVSQRARMKSTEFSAELIILLIEGPQDKKSSVDLYYGKYAHEFQEANSIESKLRTYLAWIVRVLPQLSMTRYRKPVDLYALIGALDIASHQGKRLSKLNPKAAGQALTDFERRTRSKTPSGEAARYLAAASRQTDNIIPRTTRIEILERLLRA